MYRVKDGPFMLRVSARDGSSIRTSTGTVSEVVAKEVRQMLRDMKAAREWRILDAIVAKRFTLRDVFDAHRQNRLSELLTELDDADLDPLVSEWERSGANERYVFHVRRLIPEGVRCPASRFRRKTISVFLASLPVSGSTKNRHKASLSVFAKWLVEREVIESNPVRDVKSSKPNPARMVWLSRRDAKRLVDALPLPYKALEALMAGTGMEWAAIEKTTRADVDVKTRKIHAKGSKTAYRNRIVRVTEDWTWPIIQKHLKTLLPDAPLFTVSHKDALNQHHEAGEALGLPYSTLHDWRHTYAVNCLKDGMAPAAVKKQLGHAPNSKEVETIYGVYIPDDSDYAITPKRTRNASL